MSLGIKLITVGGLLSNCLVTGLLLFISHNNYPGGVALQRLHKLMDNHTGIRNNQKYLIYYIGFGMVISKIFTDLGSKSSVQRLFKRMIVLLYSRMHHYLVGAANSQC